MNLVADAIKELVHGFRNDDSAYVVLAGGDDVIPFFRYPDVSGLGEESQFSPPVRDNTPSGASLKADQVQSQDAYGSDTTVTISGVTLPVPDLAVGRLVKTPDEIESTVSHYLGLTNGTLPTPTSSLVTGYDFLADAADGVHDQFDAAIPGGTNDTLIDHPGVTRDRDDHWTAPSSATRCSGRTTTWSTWPVTSAPTTPWPPTSSRRSTPTSWTRTEPTRTRSRTPSCSAPAATRGTTSSTRPACLR